MKVEMEVVVVVVASVGGWWWWPLAGGVRPDPATHNLTTSQASPQPAISEGQLWCVVRSEVITSEGQTDSELTTTMRLPHAELDLLELS